MKKTKHVYRSPWWYSTTLTLLLMQSVGVPAHALSREDGLIDDQVSVRELMRLDTEQALTLARARSSASNHLASQNTQRVSRSMSGDPRLAAIYGVGRQLMAEVLLDHVVYVYRRGQALPVGIAPGDDVYVLKSISTSCIELKKQDDLHHLCLRPKQWVGK